MTLANVGDRNLFISQIRDFNERDSWKSMDCQSITDVTSEKIQEILCKNPKLMNYSSLKNDPELCALLKKLASRILDTGHLLSRNHRVLSHIINLKAKLFKQIVDAHNGNDFGIMSKRLIMNSSFCCFVGHPFSDGKPIEKKLTFLIDTDDIAEVGFPDKSGYCFTYYMYSSERKIETCESVEIEINDKKHTLPGSLSSNLIRLFSDSNANEPFCCVDLVTYLYNKFKLHCINFDEWRIDPDCTKFDIGDVIVMGTSENANPVPQDIKHYATYMGREEVSQQEIFMSLWGFSPLMFSNLKQMKDYYSPNFMFKIYLKLQV